MSAMFHSYLFLAVSKRSQQCLHHGPEWLYETNKHNQKVSLSLHPYLKTSFELISFPWMLSDAHHRSARSFLSSSLVSSTFLQL